MKSLEEIVYDAGRHALADQEALVNGIRQRTGTLLAAHAVVASFIGATTIRSSGLDGLGWVAFGALAAGLVIAAFLLAPWSLQFAVDARVLYAQMYDEAAAEAQTDTDGWLVAAGYGYQALRYENAGRVRLMSRLSAGLSLLMVVQTLFWIASLAL